MLLTTSVSYIWYCRWGSLPHESPIHDRRWMRERRLFGHVCPPTSRATKRSKSFHSNLMWFTPSSSFSQLTVRNLYFVCPRFSCIFVQYTLRAHVSHGETARRGRDTERIVRRGTWSVNWLSQDISVVWRACAPPAVVQRNDEHDLARCWHLGMVVISSNYIVMLCTVFEMAHVWQCSWLGSFTLNSWYARFRETTWTVGEKTYFQHFAGKHMRASLNVHALQKV